MRRFFGELLHDPNLWHLNRYSVSWGVSVGLFMAFMPFPLQMFAAAAAAIVISCNLPIAVALVWITNPLTVAPMFFAAYLIGAWMLGREAHSLSFEVSTDWLLSRLGEIWQPLLLGCLVLGISSAVLGHIAVRIIWRVHIVTSWRERQRRRERRAVRALERQRAASVNQAPTSAERGRSRPAAND